MEVYAHRTDWGPYYIIPMYSTPSLHWLISLLALPSSKLTPSFPLVVSPPAFATSEGQDGPHQIQGCWEGAVRAILRWVLEGSDLLPPQLMSAQCPVTFSGILYPEETGTGCITSQPQQPIPAQNGDQRTPHRGGAVNSPWQITTPPSIHKLPGGREKRLRANAHLR